MPKDFHSYTVRKTKIRRRCENCSKIIPKKQSYYRGVGRSKGQFTVHILCCQCGAQELQRKEEEKDESNGVFDDYLQF
jgi:hypothetical protein